MSTEPPGPATDHTTPPEPEVKGPLYPCTSKTCPYPMVSDVFITSLDGWDIYNAGDFWFANRNILYVEDSEYYESVWSFNQFGSATFYPEVGDPSEPLPESVKDYLTAYRKLIS